MKKILLKNARIYPLTQDYINKNEEIIVYNSMLIEDNKIVAVGQNIAADDSSLVIDLDNKTVLPSFTDAHMHFFQTGFLYAGCKYFDVKSEDELLSRISEDIKGKSVFQSWGYDPDGLLPSQKSLDDISKSIPMFVRRIDGHSSALNSKALEIVMEHVEGKYDPDDYDKQNGHLYSTLHLDAERFFLELADEAILENAMKAVEKNVVSKGVTSLHALVHKKEWVQYLQSRQSSLNISTEIFFESWNPIQAVELGLERVGGCLLIDGSFGSHTAAITFPYEDRSDSNGCLYHSFDEVKKVISLASQDNLQTAFHAIGDRAVQQVLDAHSDSGWLNAKKLRHRIEHALLLSDEQLDIIKANNIILSMQPAFEHLWGGKDSMYHKRLGDRVNVVNPYRSIIDKGIMIAGGSDSYITPIDPLLGIHACVNHSNPEQRTSVYEALRIFTYNPAYAVHKEDQYGSLRAGLDASFVILDENPFESDSIRDIKVNSTYYKGKKVF